MSLRRYRTAREQPWRNGRGVTRVLHDGGDWRLSVATISRAGEFSAFPGLDRVFVVARGTVDLDIDGTGHRLGPHDSVRFPGEAGVLAVPADGEVIAVNVMTTRGTHVAEVTVTRIDGPVPPADALVLLDGMVETGGTTLHPLDALVPVGSARSSGALAALITLARHRPVRDG